MTTESMTPEEAVELYLETRKSDTADATLQKHHYRLKKFLEWADVEGIEDVSTLDGRKLHEFRLWRREDGDLNNVSLKNQLSCLRVFIGFCESIDAVEEGLADKIELPSIGEKENVRDDLLKAERAKQIQEYLRKFAYATREHVLFLLLWQTGIRLGTAQGLDVDDVEEEERRLRIRHRPEDDTPLKNAKTAERYIALDEETVGVVADWIAHNRPNETDENGRRPLFATSYGRCSKGTLRKTVYRLTQPCFYSDDCPHGREPESCEAVGYRGGAKCPSSTYPHSIRRGAITNFLANDVPDKIVSDRMDVSGKVLDKHYDRRSEERKTEQRRAYLDNV